MAIKAIWRSTASGEADADTNGPRSVSARHCWQGYTNSFREIGCAIGGPDGVTDERALPHFVKRQRRIHAARTIKVAVHQTVEDMADVEPAGPASSVCVTHDV